MRIHLFNESPWGIPQEDRILITVPRLPGVNLEVIRGPRVINIMYNGR